MKKIEEADQLRAQLQAQFSHVESLHQPIGMQQGRMTFLKSKYLPTLESHLWERVKDFDSLTVKLSNGKTVPCVLIILVRLRQQNLLHHLPPRRVTPAVRPFPIILAKSVP